LKFRTVSTFVIIDWFASIFVFAVWTFSLYI